MESSKSYQEKYWQELVQTKGQILYLQKYHERYERVNRWLEMVLAVVSTGSLATWVLVQQYPFVWGTIIVLSQVVTAIKPFLPYQKNMKHIFGLISELQDISLFIERHWYDVREGKLTEKEIHDLTIEIKERIMQADKKHFSDFILPKNEKLLQLATSDANQYSENNY
jgi:hypothetical protein